MVKALPGEEVPPNSYVKLKVKNMSVLDKMAPNVVKLEVDSEKTSLTLDVNSSLREKIIEGVKQQGVKDEVLSLALSEIESLLVGVSE